MCIYMYAITSWSIYKPIQNTHLIHLPFIAYLYLQAQKAKSNKSIVNAFAKRTYFIFESS